MLKAKDKHGHTVSIDFADESEIYLCPICDQPLMQKRGTERAHHFAHYGPKNRNGFIPCSDPWNYDKTEWHMGWQKKFPEECYEVVVNKDGEKHIADILINGVVIEFQHSSLSIEDFRKRNAFYKKCGYEIIWVFDLIEAYEEDRIYDGKKSNEYHWLWVKNLFKEIEDLRDEETSAVYFQLSEAQDSEQLFRVINGYNDFHTFYVDEYRSFTEEEFVDIARKNISRLIPQKQQKITETEIKQVDGQGKTIPELWSDDYESMVVENMATGKHVLINSGGRWADPIDGVVIMGCTTWKDWKTGQYKYTNSYRVPDAKKHIWKLVHIKKRKIVPVVRQPAYNGKILIEAIKVLRAESGIVRCMKTRKTYYVNIVSYDGGQPLFNAYEFDLSTGEINDAIANAEVWEMGTEPVWEIVENQMIDRRQNHVQRVI